MENLTQLLAEWDAKVVALEQALQEIAHWPPTANTVQRRQQLETQLLEAQQSRTLVQDLLGLL